MSRITASGGDFGERVERLLAVGGELDVVVVEPQRALERPPDRGLVVDYQYARHAANDAASSVKVGEEGSRRCRRLSIAMWASLQWAHRHRSTRWPKEQARQSYRRKRDFADARRSRRPIRRDARRGRRSDGERRFVVQEHHATRLHWDLRLEHDGVLASWAIPNGIPPIPTENRLAVRTEDHPLEYLEFHGRDPQRASTAPGTMTIWDQGTYEVHKWEDRKVEVTFHGERLHGRYGLFPIGRGRRAKDDWMIHRMDPPDGSGAASRCPSGSCRCWRSAGERAAARSDATWSFEVKWDGVRAIAYVQPGRLRLESRNLDEITDSLSRGPRRWCAALGMHEAVLDGEIVAFDDGRRARASSASSGGCT